MLSTELLTNSSCNSPYSNQWLQAFEWRFLSPSVFDFHICGYNTEYSIKSHTCTHTEISSIYRSDIDKINAFFKQQKLSQFHQQFISFERDHILVNIYSAHSFKFVYFQFTDSV